MADSENRKSKKLVLEILQSSSWEDAESELLRLPKQRTINSLFSHLLHSDEKVRCRSVASMGLVMNGLVQEDIERARIVMRRFMWSLNDESGGIGWGAPDCMGEIMAVNERMANEYSSVFVSYFNPDGNFLEYDILQRGLLWGLRRVASVRPELFVEAGNFLESYLESTDVTVRGLAAECVGILRLCSLKGVLQKLATDTSVYRVCSRGDVETLSVRDAVLKIMADL